MEKIDMKLSAKEWRAQLIVRWLGSITLDKDEVEWAYRLADKLMESLYGDRTHWPYEALENKRQGFLAESALNKLLSEAGLKVYWANPLSPQKDLSPYDFHIAKIPDGDIEVKSFLKGSTEFWIKEKAWKYSEAHYVVVFEILSPEILSMDLKEAQNKTASLRLAGYLKREHVERRKPRMGPFAEGRPFKVSELRSPKKILQKLIKLDRAQEGIRRMK